MKSVVVVTCLLAAATVVRSQEVNLIEKYLEYLMPFIKPCSEETGVSEDTMRNVQPVLSADDMAKMACTRACVMKRMGALEGMKVQIAPLHAMIDTVHSHEPAAIDKVKQIATNCVAKAEAEADECNLALKYSDCYIAELLATY